MDKPPINIAIIEDNEENVDVLKIFLDRYNVDTNIKYIARDGFEARGILSNKDIDIALVDIDLGLETIFDVLQEIDYSHLDDSMIFVTAHGTFENALKAIRFSCLNFITKPIDFDELQRTLDEVIFRNRKQGTSRIYELLRNLRNHESPKRIGIFLAKGVIEFVDCDAILYITANDTISHFNLENRVSLNSTRNLGYYSKLLTSHRDFIQIHKSTLINLRKTKRFDQRNQLFVMSDGEELKISRRKMKAVQNAIKYL